MIGTVIVGAGPAGCAAAIALARAGHRPLLLEREAAAAEKVCGEFLGADAARLLAGLGLQLPALGAVPIRRGVLGSGRWRAALDLPFPGWGLPRATLDAALRAAALSAGAEIRTGVAVQAAAREAGGWRLRLPGAGELRAERLVLATGKHDLRGVPRPRRAGAALGLKLPLEGVAVEGTIALLVCAGGYAGLQPRPGGGANLCAALDPAAPGVAAAARDAAALVAHVAAGSRLAGSLLRDAVPALARPMAVAGVPYGFLHRAAGDAAGPFRAGDQAAVIPSFCGDGVAMALGSGRMAAQAILAGHEPAAHHAGWARAAAGQMRLAAALAAMVRHAPGLLVGGAALLPAALRGAALATRSRA